MATLTKAAVPSQEEARPRFAFLRNERVLYGLLGFVVLLGAWEAASRLGLIKTSLMSSPSRVVEIAIDAFGSGEIWPHMWVSFQEWLFGFAISLAIGIPIGLALGWFRKAEALFGMLIPAFYSTPKVALAPLVILVAGIGFEAKVVTVVLLTVMAVMVNTMMGVMAVDKRHYDIARSFGASRWLTFRAVALPTAIPFILTGIRIGMGRALVGVVVAEFLSSTKGIGFYITFSGAVADTTRVMLGILILGLFGVIVGELIRRVDKRFDAWRPGIH